MSKKRYFPILKDVPKGRKCCCVKDNETDVVIDDASKLSDLLNEKESYILELEDFCNVVSEKLTNLIRENNELKNYYRSLEDIQELRNRLAVQSDKEKYNYHYGHYEVF